MLIKLEWLGYPKVKKLWQYVKPFSSDTGTSRTDGQTDGQTELLYQYRSSVCWRAIKITLLHSVSVITNFVIRKRDTKQTRNLKSICITSEAVQYWQALNLLSDFGEILSLSLDSQVSWAKFESYRYSNMALSSSKSRKFRILGKNLPLRDKSPRVRKNAYNLVVCPPNATKLKLRKLPIDAYKRWEFRKNNANESPPRGKFMAKIPNFASFGAVFPHFCPDNVKFGVGERSCPPCQISRYRGNVSPAPVGRKTHFESLSKNNQ